MNLIIYPPKSAVAISIFNYQIYWYGIILTLSIITGLCVCFFLIKQKYDFKKADEFLDFSPLLILNSIIGARLFYVLGSFNYYINNPKEIILIHHGGISIYGAIIFGTIALYIYLKKQNHNTGKYFDIVSISMPLAQAVGRWGNYFNQEAIGKPTDGFIKLYVDYKYRTAQYKDFDYFHPAFLYESVLNFILFIFLIHLFYKNNNLKDGTIFCLYLVFYGLIRIFVEYYRIDSVVYFYNFPIAQIISFIAIVTAFAGLVRIYKK